MVTLLAKKKIEIHRLTAVLTLRVSENRPDLQWLLRNLDLPQLSSAERQNLRRYLRYLGLLDDQGLTLLGEETVRKGVAPIPEAGVYELSYIKDFAIGNLVIQFTRVGARSRLDEAPEVFGDFSLLEGKPFVSWNAEKNELPFVVEFGRPPNEPPRVIRGPDLPAEVELLHDSASGSRWKVGAQGFAAELPCLNFRLDQNMDRLVNQWEPLLFAQLVEFDEVRSSPQVLREFRHTIRPKGAPHLRFANGEDPAAYEIELQGVEVIPSSLRDAELWLVTLLREVIAAESAFCTIDHVEQSERALLAKTPLSRRYPKVFVRGNVVLETLKGEMEHATTPDVEDLFWRIQAAEDLSSLEPTKGSTVRASAAAEAEDHGRG